MRVGVVDIGTNSTRLLVARVEDGRVEELERRTLVTRLGEGVDATGRLAPEAMERVDRALAGFARALEEQGATATVGVATSAMRDADNGEAFREEIRERYGIEARTISGDEEAELTFLGATVGRDPSSGTMMVVDIGGGSTELVTGAPGAVPDFHVSARAGSVRQTERHLHTDPPTGEELASLRAEVREILAADVPEEVRRSAEHGIAVAGTATTLAAIDQQLHPYDPERVHGYVVRREAVEDMLASLAALPLAERREVTGLHPDRAPTIVAGAAILGEAMEAFGLGAIEISEWDLLHGAALRAARADRTT